MLKIIANNLFEINFSKIKVKIRKQQQQQEQKSLNIFLPYRDNPSNANYYYTRRVKQIFNKLLNLSERKQSRSSSS